MMRVWINFPTFLWRDVSVDMNKVVNKDKKMGLLFVD